MFAGAGDNALAFGPSSRNAWRVGKTSIFVLSVGLAGCGGGTQSNPGNWQDWEVSGRAAMMPAAAGATGGGGMGNGGDANGGSAAAGATGSANPYVMGLDDADGITGTFEGVVHAHKFKSVVIRGRFSLDLRADSALAAPLDSWLIHLPSSVGFYECTSDPVTNRGLVSFKSESNSSLSGTTDGPRGTCSIDVTSVSPKIEGTFTAALATDHATVTVKDGYFRVPQ